MSDFEPYIPFSAQPDLMSDGYHNNDIMARAKVRIGQEPIGIDPEMLKILYAGYRIEFLEKALVHIVGKEEYNKFYSRNRGDVNVQETYQKTQSSKPISKATESR